MLHCEYCNYYKVLSVHRNSGEKKTSICEYSSYVFSGEIEDLDMEYPCNSIGKKSQHDEKIVLRVDEDRIIA